MSELELEMFGRANSKINNYRLFGKNIANALGALNSVQEKKGIKKAT